MFLLLQLACQDATLATANDAPEVTILRPAEGATFDPSVPVALCAQIDDERAADTLTLSVESDVDGEVAAGVGEACSGGNMGWSFTLTNRDHHLTVLAIDEAGKVGTASTFVVPESNEAPVCGFSSPTAGSAIYLGQSVDVVAGASDTNSDPAELEAEIVSDLDGTLWAGTPSSAGVVSFVWTPMSGDTHHLTMTLTDPVGLVGRCQTDLYVEACNDLDGDGWTDCEECDDTDPTVYPGAEELADNTDNDCDGEVDEGTRYADDDGDGLAEVDGDCDDDDASIHPGATDPWYDGVDQDCAGNDDFDQDGDGYASDAYGGDDCDDLDATVYVGAVDAWYDGVDSDCAGNDDYDQDGDGETSDAYGGDDCDDADPAIHPGAADAWYDGVDADCAGNDDYDKDGDGSRDPSGGGADCDDTDPARAPGLADTWYDGVDSDCAGNDDYDQDGDGQRSDLYGGDDCDDTDPTVFLGAAEVWYDGVDEACDGGDDHDRDGDGHASDAWSGDDCDDTDASVFPGAADTPYDGVDADCAGDDDYDQDGDGFRPAVWGGSDCDDTDASAFPGAPDTWYDGVDSDCAGNDDFDQDGDGHASDRYAGDDCDDLDDTVNPGASETWYDGIDADCSGGSDYDADADGDDASDWGGTDCDDEDPTAYGGAAEVRDGVDNDCDGYCDESLLAAGDLVISEIMPNPALTTDPLGEWFEVYNTTTTDIRICKWTVADNVGSHVMSEPVYVPAGGYAVFGYSDSYSAMGGVVVDYSYAGALLLSNTADRIVLTDPFVGEIDRVEWTTSFPYASGYSMELRKTKLDRVSNDTASSWCAASSKFNATDYGTPGSPNGC
jgi:hypothetical protein